MRAAAGGGASEAVVHGAVVVVLGRRSCEDESTTPQWETTINIGPEDTGGRVRQRQVEDQSAVLPNDDATAVAADNNVAVCPEDHAALPPSCWLKCCYSCGQGMLECLMLLIRHGLSTCDYLHGISSTSIYWAQVLHMVYLAHPSTCHLLAFFLSGIGCNLLFVTRCHRRNEILPKFFWPSSACESVICKHYATMTLRLFMRSHPLKTTIKLRRCLNKLVGKGSELSKEFKRKLSPCCESLDSDGYCGQQGESSAELLYTVCDNSNRFFYWDDKHPTHAGWEAVMKQLEKPLREFVNQA